MKPSWQTHKICPPTTLTATQASVMPVKVVNAATVGAVAVGVVNAHPQARPTTPRQPKTHGQRRLQHLLSPIALTPRQQITA